MRNVKYKGSSTTIVFRSTILEYLTSINLLMSIVFFFFFLFVLFYFSTTTLWTRSFPIDGVSGFYYYYF